MTEPQILWYEQPAQEAITEGLPLGNGHLGLLVLGDPAHERLVLNESWAAKRMKALRFSLINLPGRIMEHARETMIHIAQSHPSLELLLRARQTIMELAHGSG